MGPRANFECRQCAEVAGHPESVVVIEDLPITCTRCPICGWKRGFKRRFDAIQVSTTGHRVAKILDPMMEPQFAEASRVREAAKQSERTLIESHAQAVAALPEDKRPAMREALQAGPIRWLSHQADKTLGGLHPAARSDSRQYIYPALKHRIVPVRGD